MKAILSLVPFFDGIGEAAPSNPAKRRDYLYRCLNSLPGRVVVGCLAADETLVRLVSDVQIQIQTLDTEPQYLPVALAEWAQAETDEELVLLTEADQVWHIDPSVLALVEADRYLVPHRLERLGDKGQGSSRGEVVVYRGKSWVLPNGYQPGENYSPKGHIDACGGGFVSSRELFGRVSFKRSYFEPIEHATEFCIRETGQPIKTGTWKGCFVEHLSGREFHNTL